MAIQIFNRSLGSSLLQTGKTGAKHIMYAAFDPVYQEGLEKALKAPNATIGGALKDACKVTEQKAAGQNIFKRMWKSLTGIKKDYSKLNTKMARQSKNTELLSRYTARYGKKLSSLGKFSKYLKPLSKRMPMIGNLIAAAFAIPNIINAFSKGGAVAGTVETGKEATKLAGFAVGASVGQVLIPIPFVGAIVGGVIGGWLTEKVVGKSFTEKAQEKAAEAQPQPKAQPELESQAHPQSTKKAATQEGGLTPEQQAQLMQQYQQQQAAAQTQTNNFNPYMTQQQTQQPQAQTTFNPFALGQMNMQGNPYAFNANRQTGMFNPSAQFNPNAFGMNNQMGINPFNQYDYLHKDLMAMNAGLI